MSRYKLFIILNAFTRQNSTLARRTARPEIQSKLHCYRLGDLVSKSSNTRAKITRTRESFAVVFLRRKKKGLRQSNYMYVRVGTKLNAPAYESLVRLKTVGFKKIILSSPSFFSSPFASIHDCGALMSVIMKADSLTLPQTMELHNCAGWPFLVSFEALLMDLLTSVFLPRLDSISPIPRSQRVWQTTPI